jgi:hypothetical protein
MLEAVRDSLPNSVSNSILASVNNLTIDTLNSAIDGLSAEDKATFENNLKQIFRKWTNIIVYLQAVQLAYQKKLISKYLEKQDTSFKHASEDKKEKMIEDKIDDTVFLKDHIDEDMKNFNDKNLRTLIESQDIAIQSVFENPALPKETLEEITSNNQDQTDLLEKLENEGTHSPEVLKEVAEDLISEIDSKGYMQWHTARSTML